MVYYQNVNKKISNKYPNEGPLDDYERELEKFLDKGEYISVPKKEFEETKKMFQEAARNYFEMKKSKKITLRVKNEDLIKVKAKAEKTGIPYQRLIRTLIKQYSEDKIHLTI